MSIDAFDDPDLLALVSEAMEMRDRGLEPALEEICRERPDLVEAVAQSIETAERLPILQRKSSSRDSFVGRVLDSRYRLKARLGAGAMGVVYVGEDLELQRPVAVKILRAALLDEQESEHRFSREAEVLAAIRHTSVVTIFDRGRTSDDDPYLVMELLEGESLSDILEEGKRSGATAHGHDTSWIARALGVESLDEPSYLRTVARWTADLASGLGAAHAKGIFHRDVKPSNVFVRRDGRPVLLDFGIAARLSQATITREGMALGTPAYMAPESLSETFRPDATLDVYGLSATLYHMLTLRPPYSGTPSQIFSTLATKEPPPAARLREGLPRDLQAILDRGMARRPSDRYASAAELEADLRAFLDYRPVKARHVSSAMRVWRRLSRSPAFIAGSSVAVLALAGVLGVQWRSAWVAGREAAHRDLWRHLPPNLTIVAMENRTLSAEEGRDEVEALLDAAAEVCVHPLPTLLIRAAFRLDRADPRGAAQDMARIARSVDSSYTRELAARYVALPASAASSMDVDTSGLPDPETRLDAYVAAFHEMRALRLADAKPLLDDPRLEDYVPAQELLQLFRARTDPHAMYEWGIWLEEQIGCRTANTAHLIGLSLLRQKQYDAAREIIDEGIELAPRSHALLINAGVVDWRLDRMDDAKRHFERAIALKPRHFRAYEFLTRVLMDLGELEEAQSIVESAPFDLLKRLVMEGEIEGERAFRHWAAEDEEASVSAALRSVAKFDEAVQHDTNVRSARWTLSRAIVDDDTGSLVSALIELLAEEPLKWRRIEIVVRLLPEDLDARDSAAVRSYLESLSAELAKRGGST